MQVRFALQRWPGVCVDTAPIRLRVTLAVGCVGRPCFSLSVKRLSETDTATGDGEGGDGNKSANGDCGDDRAGKS